MSKDSPIIFHCETMERRGVDELVPYAKNSNIHSPAHVSEIAASIKAFGWTFPILLSEDGTIIAGHCRVLAAKKLGLKQVPVITAVDWTDDQIRAYVIADNQLPKNAEVDDIIMSDELKLLSDSGFDLSLLGFSVDRLIELLGDVELPKDKDKDLDSDPPPLPAEPKSVFGDIWILGAHKVMCGDSTSGDLWLELMDGELADICWTDPPYNVDMSGINGALGEKASKTRAQHGIQNDKLDKADFIDLVVDSLRCACFAMKEGAPIYVSYSDREMVTFRSAFEAAGFQYQSNLIWKKHHFVLGRTDYHSIHEPILYGWKPGAAHKWYGGRKLVSVSDYGEDNPFVQNVDGTFSIVVGGNVITIPADTILKLEPVSMIYADKPMSSDSHPTQKPIGLIARMLENSAMRGDIVIDGFGGSGSTLIAAEELGLRARLMEIEPAFVDVIVMRWQELTGKKAVHAVTGKPF